MPGPSIGAFGIAAIGAAAAVFAARNLSSPNIYGTPLGRLLPVVGSAVATARSLTSGKRKAGPVVEVHPEWENSRANLLRVGFANVLLSNPTPEALAAEIARESPDLMILAETDDADWVGLLNDHFPSYTHLFAYAPTKASGGFALIFRYPIADVRVVPFDDVDRASLFFSVRFPGGQWVQVAAVHPAAPITREWTREWAVYFDSLNKHLPQEGSLIILGDFNATPQHGPLRKLLTESKGYLVTDAVPTWPQNDYIIGMAGGLLDFASRNLTHVLPLDHMISRGVPAWRVAFGEGAGSDHRPVYVDFGFPG